jgi:hypothetical protein
MAGVDSFTPVILLGEGMMRRPFTSMTLGLMTGLCVAAASPTVLRASNPPLAVELTGLTTILGDNRAIFVFNQTMPPSPRSFMLVEGESRFGIKLLAVDTASGCVQIENGGQKQALRICSTPTLLSQPSNRGAAGCQTKSFDRDGNGFAGNSGPGGPVDDETMAGNPGWGTLPRIGNGSTSSQNFNSDPVSAPGQNPAPNWNDVDPATPLKDQSHTEWYQESASIEQSRLETAQSVLAGEMTPWPRTPLTPAGTPPNLIAGETFFSNHIPGFVQQVPLLPAQ